MIEYKNKEFSFEEEKNICLVKPELWRNQALNLFASAQALMEFSNLQNKSRFDSENKFTDIFSKDISHQIFWSDNIVRMLWGYGFENILKGIIVNNLKKETPTLTSIPIDKIKTHELLKLFGRVNISLVEEQEFYIKIIEKCSVWMGRYPLPINSTQMYDQRKPMNTRKELAARSIELHKMRDMREIPRTFCESDVLHGAISLTEFDVIKELINLTKEKFDT